MTQLESKHVALNIPKKTSWNLLRFTVTLHTLICVINISGWQTNYKHTHRIWLLIGFPPQQWLQERASMWLYTYIAACLVYLGFWPSRRPTQYSHTGIVHAFPVDETGAEWNCPLSTPLPNVHIYIIFLSYPSPQLLAPYHHPPPLDISTRAMYRPLQYKQIPVHNQLHICWLHTIFTQIANISLSAINRLFFFSF